MRFYTIAILVLLMSCADPLGEGNGAGQGSSDVSQTALGEKEVKVLADSSFTDMVRGQMDYYSYAGEDTVYIGSPGTMYRWKNRKEIQDTYEIVEVDSVSDVAVAFIRYSVGSNIFRDVEWGERYDGYWFSRSSYFGTNTRFTDEEEERITDLRGRAVEWVDNGATIWGTR